MVFRVGTDATAIAGGTIAPQASYEVRFCVRIADSAPGGAKIENSARVSFLGTQVPDVPYERPSTGPALTISAPDLAIDKSQSGTVILGGAGTYSLLVSNVGDAVSRGPVTVSDPLFDPALYTVASVSGAGWTCAAPPGVNCTRSDALAPGASYPPITITGTFGVPRSAGSSTPRRSRAAATPTSPTTPTPRRPRPRPCPRWRSTSRRHRTRSRPGRPSSTRSRSRTPAAAPSIQYCSRTRSPRMSTRSGHPRTGQLRHDGQLQSRLARAARDDARPHRRQGRAAGPARPDLQYRPPQRPQPGVPRRPPTTRTRRTSTSA